jgi:hypothetical protein
MTQLLAPNGKPSNLTPEQWKLVRTPQFKAWFGDWENQPKTASKVVDENGEPLVVYHGSKQNINIFKKKKNTKKDNPNYVQGFWFFSAPIGNSLTQEDREYFYDEGSAEWMAENWVVNSEGDAIAKVIRCFLNVRNPIEMNSYAEFLHWINDNDVLNSIKNNEKDGWFIHGSSTDGGLFRDDINVFESNQIKLADGTNTTFDGSNPDIRFAEGGTMKKQLLAPNGKPSNLTPEQWKLVRTPHFKAWFGDWENDPENASKVVDENGEPLVVYHGTENEFTKFELNSRAHSVKNNLYESGMWFFAPSFDKSMNAQDRAYYYKKGNAEFMAEYWLGKKDEKGNFVKNKVVKAFLNVRNPIIVDGLTDYQAESLVHYSKKMRQEKKNDAVIMHGSLTDGNVFRDDINILNSNQIKLADGTNTTFDGNNPDIRFAEGGEVNSNSFMKWFVQWYKPISNKVNIAFSFSNHLQPFKEKNVVILDTFEKIDQSVDAKPYLQEIISKADEYGVVIYLEPKPRHKVGYYENFGFELTPNKLFMKREPSNPEIRFAEGGKTKRTMKRIKRGGITYGKSHAEGGIPVKNQSTGDMLEVEGGEGIVNKRSMASDKKVKLNGKEMTICEAVSQLNQLEGGVQFSCDDVSDRQFIEAMAKGGELERGTRTEQEHIQVLKDLYAKRITPKQASERIAKDHLKEDSRYYSKLAKMEGKMADGGKVSEKQLLIDYQNEFLQNNYSTNLDEVHKSSKYPSVINERKKMAKSYARKKIAENKPKRFFDVTYRTKFGAYYTERNILAVDQNQAWSEVKRYNSDIAEKYSIVLSKVQPKTNEQKMAQGGEIFDKQTEDYLSELTKKFAKGGEVVADKTETINMKDFEGYADQYNGRKNKFFKATDEYQLLVNEGMDVKNNKDLPQDEKDKLLAELREKAREAKSKLNEERKDFVDMREVKSPFYAPQLADGGIFSSLPKSVRIPSEIKEIVQSKGDFASDTIYQFLISKSERFPKIISKGIFANFRISNSKEGIRTRINFSISSKATYEKDDNGVWKNVADTLEVIPSLKSDISSISVNKIARGYDVYFFITKPLSFIDIYNITANVIQNLIDYDSFNSFQKLFKEGEKTTPPPTEKKKEITEKDVQNEVFRWTEEKVKEKKDINERKYQTSNLIDWILLNQNGGSMVEFSELIAMAKQSEKVNREMVRLTNEGLPIDGFVMQLMYKKVLQLVEDIKSQIMLFVLFESEVRQQLDILVFHIKYLAELDTFDKDYILHIK